MRLYYFVENDQQLGPFTIEELKSKRLKKSTLVWTDGLPDWTSADQVEELKEIIVSEPPPLPKKEKEKKIETITIKQDPLPATSLKYDLTYSKEIGATITGILLLVVSIIIKLSGGFTFHDIDSYRQAIFNFICFLVIRISVTVWVVNIAKRQNRNSIGWGLFAFFLPSIALIIIGLLKKLRLKLDKLFPKK